MKELREILNSLYLEVCPLCHGRRRLEVEGRWELCECAEREAEADRREALLRWCELPPPLRRMTFEAFEPRRAVPGLAEAVPWLRAYAAAAQAKPWVWLKGDRGTGKTHLAAAVLNYRLEHPELPPGKYVYVEDWLDQLRQGYENNAYTERFHLYCEAPLLVLDDLGAHQGTAWAVTKVDQLVDYRYRHQLATIFTTNPKATLPERAEDRLPDKRLCQCFELRGPSYRRQP